MIEDQEHFATLMRRVREGSQDAARELVELYQPHILRAVRRRLNRSLRSKFDSTDFMQAVWASFFANLPASNSLDRSESLVAFLSQLARNMVIDEFRRRLQTDKYDLSREKSLDSSSIFPERALVGPSPTPSQLAVARERWDQLLQGQPPLHQRILALRRLGNTCEEVATKLGVHERTVRRVIRKISSSQLP